MVCPTKIPSEALLSLLIVKTHPERAVLMGSGVSMLVQI
jgi:hypothetical protein